jgi:hypothetical protein
MFAACSLLYFASEKYQKLNKLFVVMAILIPSIIAGLRDSSIGTDVTVYGISFFERALHSGGLFSFLNLQRLLGHTDMGYNIIVYLVSRVTKDYHWSFFVFQLITQMAFYIGVKRCNKIYSTSVWLGMLLIQISLYNYSLNIMRQMLAVSLVFLASTFLLEANYKLFVVFTVLAVLMHSSGIIGFILLPVYIILERYKEKNRLTQVVSALVLGFLGVLVVFGFNSITSQLVKIGLLRGNHLQYLQGGQYIVAEGARSVPLQTFAVQFIYLAALIGLFAYLERHKLQPVFYIFLSSLVMIITCFGPLFVMYISRTGYFFVPLQMIGIANTRVCFEKKSRIIWIGFIIAATLAVWYINIVVLKYGETVPYAFCWNN